MVTLASYGVYGFLVPIRLCLGSSKSLVIGRASFIMKNHLQLHKNNGKNTTQL